MFSLVKKIFSSGKVIDDIFDKDNGHLKSVGEWIDNRSFTDEEKVKANAKMVNQVIDYAKATMSENTERSKSRREIAKAIVYSMIILSFSSAVAFPFNEEYAKFLWGMATSNWIGGAFLSVIVFFFGSHLISGHMNNKKP